MEGFKLGLGIGKFTFKIIGKGGFFIGNFHLGLTNLDVLFSALGSWHSARSCDI